MDIPLKTSPLQSTLVSTSRTTWNGAPISTPLPTKPTRHLASSGATSRSATGRRRKQRTKPLFDRYLSMQPQSGIPTLKMRSAPSRKSNAERQDGSQTDAAKYRASVPSGTLWNGHLFNNAAESPIGYVFQAPPWPHLHQLQLSAKTNKRKMWLEEEQRLQLWHPLLPDTKQADVVLPESYTRLEQSASGDRGGWHAGLLQVQAQLPLETVTLSPTPPPRISRWTTETISSPPFIYLFIYLLIYCLVDTPPQCALKQQIMSEPSTHWSWTLSGRRRRRDITYPLFFLEEGTELTLFLFLFCTWKWVIWAFALLVCCTVVLYLKKRWSKTSYGKRKRAATNHRNVDWLADRFAGQQDDDGAHPVNY